MIEIGMAITTGLPAVLVACEESQVISKAFRDHGISAFSCDLTPCSGGDPAWHIQGDAVEIASRGCWDMMIAHPPCDHIAVSGARWFPQKRADGRQRRAVQFFFDLVTAPVPRIAVENPVSIMSTEWRKPDQIIQPWQFGHDASKKTCLWLKNLPQLSPTEVIEKERYANQTPSGQNKLGPSPNRSQARSKTYEGIAQAMAKQWGSLCTQ